MPRWCAANNVSPPVRRKTAYKFTVVTHIFPVSAPHFSVKKGADYENLFGFAARAGPAIAGKRWSVRRRAAYLRRGSLTS